MEEEIWPFVQAERRGQAATCLEQQETGTLYGHLGVIESGPCKCAFCLTGGGARALTDI